MPVALDVVQHENRAGARRQPGHGSLEVDVVIRGGRTDGVVDPHDLVDLRLLLAAPTVGAALGEHQVDGDASQPGRHPGRVRIPDTGR